MLSNLWSLPWYILVSNLYIVHLKLLQCYIAIKNKNKKSHLKIPDINQRHITNWGFIQENLLDLNKNSGSLWHFSQGCSHPWAPFTSAPSPGNSTRPQQMERALRTGSSAAWLQGADCAWSRAWEIPAWALQETIVICGKPSGKANILGSLTCWCSLRPAQKADQPGI